jgi:hypothetical protein
LVDFNNFLKIHDYYKVEIGDTDVAWSVSSVTADLGVNVSTDVTFAGSASLAVPVAMIFAAFATL